MVTSLVAYQTCSMFMFMPIGHHTMYGVWSTLCKLAVPRLSYRRAQ